jgi:hypothetical protein
MRWRFPGLGLAALAASLAIGAAGAPRAGAPSGDLERRAAVIRPAAAELKWQQIPWLLDLTEGLRAAREQRRPIFLWVTGDDPLERC